MDENKEVNTTDPKREKVRVIPLSAIDDAPDHPFGVRDDEEMAELVESISTFGVINPVIVRKGEGERYELISGHRRRYVILAALSFQQELPTAHTRIRRGSIIPQVSTSDTRTVTTVTIPKHSTKVIHLKPSLSSTPHLSISITLIAPSVTVWLVTPIPKHIPLPLPRVTETLSIPAPSVDIPIP